MHTLATLAQALNRPTIQVRGLLDRFELPILAREAYSEGYLAFLRTVVFLRALNVPEETLRDLWRREKKLLQLLHADSTGSPTWFLDSCEAKGQARRRLLLTNYDVGFAIPARAVQLGLNFAATPAELFGGAEMGEDALRVLNECIAIYSRLRTDLGLEVPQVRAGATWATGRFGLARRNQTP